MEKRRVLLIVFSISTILVLAGFSANEKSYAGNTIPVDELHCYELGLLNGPALPFIEIILKDQFQDEPHEILEILEICNPVDKETTNFSNIFNVTDEHWTAYVINTTINEPQVIATVKIIDQFHEEGLIVDVFDIATVLMVPAEKEHNTNVFQSFSTSHFKCYILDTVPPIDEEFSLTDQFATRTYVQLQPIEICNPVEKFREMTPGDGNFIFEAGDKNINEHYLCYDITPEVEGPPSVAEPDFIFDDQFLIDVDATIIRDDVLCTLATKEIIGPVVGGINIPIDTSSLLLAGVKSISMWMIPVVIAGVGIGIFVIKRRK